MWACFRFFLTSLCNWRLAAKLRLSVCFFVRITFTELLFYTYDAYNGRVGSTISWCPTSCWISKISQPWYLMAQIHHDHHSLALTEAELRPFTLLLIASLAILVHHSEAGNSSTMTMMETQRFLIDYTCVRSTKKDVSVLYHLSRLLGRKVLQGQAGSHLGHQNLRVVSIDKWYRVQKGVPRTFRAVAFTYIYM